MNVQLPITVRLFCGQARSKFQYPLLSGMKGKSKAYARKKNIWPVDSDREDIDGSSYEHSSDELAMTFPPPGNRKYSGMSSMNGMMNGMNSMNMTAAQKDRVKPRNPRQMEYMNLLESVNPAVILAVGPAGTGKTMLACHVGLKKLADGDINKLVLTRPAVSVEEQHGFLPGTLEEKMDPWLKPIYDIMYQYFSVPKVQQLIKNQVIEICPLAYMRGRTFERSWIIADEAQNMTPNQMLMLLTRIGHHSKMIITGDPNQHDRGFEINGLNDLLKRMNRFRDHKIGLVQFTENDVERHPIIKNILKLYKDKQKHPSSPVYKPIMGSLDHDHDHEIDMDIGMENDPTVLETSITDTDEMIIGEIELEGNIEFVREIVKEIFDEKK